MRQIGLNALLTIISNFTFILITFKILRDLRLDYYVNTDVSAVSYFGFNGPGLFSKSVFPKLHR